MMPYSERLPLRKSRLKSDHDRYIIMQLHAAMPIYRSPSTATAHGGGHREGGVRRHCDQADLLCCCGRLYGGGSP